MKVKNNALAIFGLYFVTRLINLTRLPIFNDEAIYLDWGQRMLKSGELFLSLYDGKQPLLMWVFGGTEKLFADPLLAGRLVSVVAGFITLLGIYFLCEKYYSKRTFLVAGVIYVASPLFLFFDRQALMESATSAVGVWSFYVLLLLIEKPIFLNSLRLILLWVVGLWIKSSVMVFVLSSLLVVFAAAGKKRKEVIGMVGFSIVLAAVLMLPLLIQKDGLKIFSLNSRYGLGIDELIKLPVDLWWNNLRSLIEILFFQVGGLVLLLPATWLKRGRLKKIDLMMLAWLGASLVLYLILARTGKSRYLVSLLPLVTIVLANAVRHYKRLGLVFLWVSLVWMGYLDLLLITSPLDYFGRLKSVSAFSQIEDYTEGFTSGYEVKKAVDYVVGEVGNHEAIVGVRLDTGNPESAVWVYLSKYPNIDVVYLDEKLVDLPENQDYIGSSKPIYFISRDQHLAGLERFVELDREFVKLDGGVVGVYKVRTESK